jgi:hypothetical protein
MPNLTPQQLQVVDALSGGATLTTAAAQAGIHRNTVANRRRDSNHFRQAMDPAHYDRAATFIIDKIVNPPQPGKEKPASMADLSAAMIEFDRARFLPERPANAQQCTTVHNDAPFDPAPRAEAAPNPVFYMHNFAQDANRSPPQAEAGPSSVLHAQPCTSAPIDPRRRPKPDRVPPSPCTILHNRRKPIAVPDPKPAAASLAHVAAARNTNTAVSTSLPPE